MQCTKVQFDNLMNLIDNEEKPGDIDKELT